MARAGRKRKPGKRTKGGRLVVMHDKGTDSAQSRQAMFGTDNADAIGRLYRSGLLGTGQEAKAMLDTARKIHAAYWAIYENGGYTCALADRTFGSVAEIDHARIKRREIWLSDCRQFVASMGTPVARSFDQLVIDQHPDSGPDWADRLCYAARANGREPDPLDKARLRQVLDALELLAQ